MVARWLHYDVVMTYIKRLCEWQQRADLRAEQVRSAIKYGVKSTCRAELEAIGYSPSTPLGLSCYPEIIQVSLIVDR